MGDYDGDGDLDILLSGRAPDSYPGYTGTMAIILSLNK